MATASECPPVALDTTPGLPRQSAPRMSSAVDGATMGPAGDDVAGDDLRPDRARDLAEAGVDPDELTLADVREAVPGQSLELGVTVREHLGHPALEMVQAHGAVVDRHIDQPEAKVRAPRDPHGTAERASAGLVDDRDACSSRSPRDTSR